ncbi:hypothetical protein PS037_23375 (plasmid) [Escherichia albertii]|uniref:hypothetical protein n=1 Tax=Escherichia albertii TaxID=208962 RepID=UPI00235E9F40|nr:hypothetical protein [Escherichia albertii]WDB54775.1 hypothetical protein PS037_23375 [Escherichia albertii]
MNGFGNYSRDAQTWRYQRAGSHAVSLEIREFWRETAEAWLLAARAAPRTDWQQFARQRAERCRRRG